MTNDEALAFLNAHQPLPPTNVAPDELFRRFDEVRLHFKEHYDERCILPLLNSFGEGDGHGVYQLVEGTLSEYPKHLVVSALKNSLRSSVPSVRTWSAEIAAGFPDTDLIEPLVAILKDGDIDARFAASTALGFIKSPESRAHLSDALMTEHEEDIRENILILLSE